MFYRNNKSMLLYKLIGSIGVILNRSREYDKQVGLTGDSG